MWSASQPKAKKKEEQIQLPTGLTKQKLFLCTHTSIHTAGQCPTHQTCVCVTSLILSNRKMLDWFWRLRQSRTSTVVVVGSAVFTDGLVYGMVVPIFVPTVLHVSTFKASNMIMHPLKKQHNFILNSNYFMHSSTASILSLNASWEFFLGFMQQGCSSSLPSLALSLTSTYPLPSNSTLYVNQSINCETVTREVWQKLVLSFSLCRFGRKWPMLAGLVGLALSTIMLAFIQLRRPSFMLNSS